jgi:hypothetical protein
VDEQSSDSFSDTGLRQLGTPEDFPLHSDRKGGPQEFQVNAENSMTNETKYKTNLPHMFKIRCKKICIKIQRPTNDHFRVKIREKGKEKRKTWFVSEVSLMSTT